MELRKILLSFQTGFNLFNAAIVCAILKNISGLEPSSVITEPRYLKLVTVSRFCPFTLISLLMPLMLFVTSLVFLHWSPCHRLGRLCQDTQLNLLVFLPLLLSHQCHQQSRDWWLFCLQCCQCLHDPLRRLSWSFPKICWRGWVRVDIPVGLSCCLEPVSYAAVEEDGKTSMMRPLVPSSSTATVIWWIILYTWIKSSLNLL